jgi:hypothetical protein
MKFGLLIVARQSYFHGSWAVGEPQQLRRRAGHPGSLFTPIHPDQAGKDTAKRRLASYITFR